MGAIPKFQSSLIAVKPACQSHGVDLLTADLAEQRGGSQEQEGDIMEPRPSVL